MKLGLRKPTFGGAIAGLAVVGTLAIAGYFFVTMAQQARNWTACTNSDHTVSPELAIAGCDAVVQSIILTKDNLAVAFIARGNAFLAWNENDRALADFDDAIRLNPKYTI